VTNLYMIHSSQDPEPGALGGLREDVASDALAGRRGWEAAIVWH
jgi:hypothetical protein